MRALPKKKFSVVDAVICAVFALSVAILSIILYTGDAGGGTATVTTSDKTFTLDLSRDRVISFSSNGYDYKATVEDGSIRITEASCPDKICCGMHGIGKQNGTIVCLPGKMTVRCEGSANDDADVIIP